MKVIKILDSAVSSLTPRHNHQPTLIELFITNPIPEWKLKKKTLAGMCVSSVGLLWKYDSVLVSYDASLEKKKYFTLTIYTKNNITELFCYFFVFRESKQKKKHFTTFSYVNPNGESDVEMITTLDMSPKKCQEHNEYATYL